jgi:sugar lactone lactonase YvrE
VDPISGNRTIVSGGGVGTGPTITRLDGIVLESGGGLFVTDSSLDAVFSVNPTTGNRSMISGGRYPSAIGTGPGFGTAAGVVVESAASLVVVDNLYDNLIRVDRATGNRTYVPNISVGTGPGSGGWLSPTGIAMGRDGVLYVAVRIFPDELLIRVDPATGDRTIVSAGAGPELVSPKGVALERNGTLVVVDSFEGSVVRVDPLTGNLTTISGGWPVVGSGPDFRVPDGIAVESNGKLVVTDTTGVLRVDPASGNRSVVSDSSHGSGPSPYMPKGIAVEANGSLVVSLQAFGGAIVRVNPVTGNRTIVSGGDPFSNTVGTGPDFIFPTGIAVLPNGTLVVVDGFSNVFRVNPLNGQPHACLQRCSGCRSSLIRPGVCCRTATAAAAHPCVQLAPIPMNSCGHLACKRVG